MRPKGLQEMSKAFILLGSNLGDRLAAISQAQQLIEERCGKILQKSKLYESVPWGFASDQNFLNRVVVVDTTCSAMQLLEELLAIELSLGRRRNSTGVYSSRIIDLDILYFDNELIDNEKLVVPHPRLHLRRFTLAPLYELAPDWVHPLLKKTHRDLLANVPDNSEVRAFEKLLD